MEQYHDISIIFTQFRSLSDNPWCQTKGFKCFRHFLLQNKKNELFFNKSNEQTLTLNVGKHTLCVHVLFDECQIGWNLGEFRKLAVNCQLSTVCVFVYEISFKCSKSKEPNFLEIFWMVESCNFFFSFLNFKNWFEKHIEFMFVAYSWIIKSLYKYHYTGCMTYRDTILDTDTPKNIVIRQNKKKFTIYTNIDPYPMQTVIRIAKPIFVVCIVYICIKHYAPEYIWNDEEEIFLLPLLSPLNVYDNEANKQTTGIKLRETERKSILTSI